MLLRPAVPPAARAWLPLLTGISVAAALRAEAGVTATLKWPNDVLVADRKIAGILAEAHGDAIVAGVGLNVTLTGAELPVPTATSLLLEGAACLDRERLLAAVLTELAGRYTAWAAGPAAAATDQADQADQAAQADQADQAARAALRTEYLRWCVTVGLAGPGGTARRGAAGRRGHRRGRDGAAGRADRLRQHARRGRRRGARPLTSAFVRGTPFRATMCAMSMEGQLPRESGAC